MTKFGLNMNVNLVLLGDSSPRWLLNAKYCRWWAVFTQDELVVCVFLCMSVLTIGLVGSFWGQWLG